VLNNGLHVYLYMCVSDGDNIKMQQRPIRSKNAYWFQLAWKTGSRRRLAVAWRHPSVHKDLESFTSH